MAIFKLPKINTVNRLNLVVDKSELLFDLDNNKYYGGDGETLGGIEIGSSFYLQSVTEFITIDAESINQIVLSKNPVNVESIRLIPEGGIEQRFGVDFDVNSNQILFEGFELENFFEIGEKVCVQYLSNQAN